MIGASKILTVSYGTFSCTLEGFDEPFNTMKAIAEYFRDLAAEDRYFGAEPPTPDAAMLHRIAEREIQRRVEAKIQDNGVILRTGDAMAGLGAEAALPAPVVQPALADAAISADSVAARLSKLRGTAAPVAAVVAVAEENYHEDQDADDLIADASATAAPADQAFAVPEALLADDITAPVAEPLAAHAEVAIAESDWQAFDLDLDDLNLSDLDVPASDLVALPPVADIDDVDLMDDADPYDDYDALAEAADLEAVAELERFDATAIEEDDQPEVEDDTLDAVAADDALLASLGALIDPDDQEYLDDDLDDAIDLDALAQADAQVLAEADALAQAAEVAEAAALAEAAQLQAKAAIMAEAAAVPQPVSDTAVAITAGFDTEPADEPAEPGRLQRARARVIKIRRADAPVADAPVADAPVAAVTTLLTPEAEAALQAELAALEAELAPEPLADVDDDALTAAVQSADPLPVVARPARPVRPVRSIAVAGSPAPAAEPTSPLPSSEATADVQDGAADAPAEQRRRIEADGADAAVSRLMAQTNSVMDGVEIKRRQSAIAHLKAAVAATEADRQVAPSQPKPDRQDAYRHDLESVVRPRQGDATIADRPSPLVLVSAQRIDRTPAPATEAPRMVAITADAPPRVVAPVRPRRIAATSATLAVADTVFGGQDDDLDEDEDFEGEAAIAANMFSDAESFGDFADRLGAVELPDMLEAAAVYCAQVLGRPQFSRPMVLSQLASLPEAAQFSREDGLRVFGTLMRQGRIAKIKHGQFAVTERSPLLAEAMRSAG